MTQPSESLQCTIVNLEGKPMKDVEIRLASGPPGSDARSYGGQYAKTRSDGRAAFANLSPGVYILQAQRKGYAALSVKVAIPAGQAIRQTLLSENEFAALEKKAGDAMNAGDFAQAIDPLKELGGFYPLDAAVHENLARAYASLLDEQKALAEAALALESDPSRTSLMQDVRGILLRGSGEKALKQRDFKTAVANFQALHELNPASADAFHGLALAYGHQGRFKEALEAIGQAIKLRPNDASLPLIKQALEANAGIR